MFTPDLAHHSSRKDVGDDDKAANAASESEIGTTSVLKISPSRPVKGSESRHIDQFEKDSCEVATLDKVPSQKVDRLYIKYGRQMQNHDCAKHPSSSSQRRCRTEVAAVNGQERNDNSSCLELLLWSFELRV